MLGSDIVSDARRLAKWLPSGPDAVGNGGITGLSTAEATPVLFARAADMATEGGDEETVLHPPPKISNRAWA